MQQQYRLYLPLDQGALHDIRESHQHIALAFEVEAWTLCGGGKPAMVWATFEPRLANLVVWSEYCRIFAMRSMPGVGEIVRPLVQSDAQANALYAFDDPIFRAGGVSTSGDYEIYNSVSDADFAFGFGMSLRVNGEVRLAPMVAIPAKFNQTACFAPCGSVWIFTTTYRGASVHGDTIPQNALRVSLDRGTPYANVGFDPQTESFFLHS
jgi:hypothetical protein